MVLASVDVACPACAYNLRGVTGSRCPECGWLIDLDAIERHLHHPRGWALVGTPLAFVVHLLVGVLALLVTGAIFFAVPKIDIFVTLWVVEIPFWMMAAGGWLLELCFDGESRSLYKPAWILLAILALTTSIATVMLGATF